MRLFYTFICICIALGSAFAKNLPHLHSAAELRQAFDLQDVYRRFDINATFVALSKNGIIFEDATGGMYAEAWALPKDMIASLVPGDRIHITGNINKSKTQRIFPCCWKLERLSAGPPPRPQNISAPDFASGRFDYRLVQLTGTVRDAFTDEIDPNYIYLSIDCDGRSVLISDHVSRRPYAEAKKLIGATVRVSGVCDPNPYMRRAFTGRMIQHVMELTVTGETPHDLFDVPDLMKLKREDPDTLLLLGRHRIRGRVLATWNDNQALVLTDSAQNGAIVKVSFATSRSPTCGENIEASGFPGTDLYDHTLVRAVWRPTETSLHTQDATAEVVSLRTLLLDNNDRRRYHPFKLNKLITVRGTFRSVPRPEYGQRAVLEADGLTLPVDISSCPKESLADLVGCTADVTGYLIADIEEWTPHNLFPEIRGTFVAIRKASDIRVVARPAWWTPSRLLAVVIALALAIVGILIWNRSLRHLAKRRGQELADACVSRAEADMRKLERTRLAVELHDALSQNLTGVAMRIQAAEQYADGARPEMTEHLAIAERTLKSCRTELKNCLWDLRSQALEEQNLDDAIRLTLKPYLGSVSLRLRFNVARSRVTDNTAHTILRIIRELTVNGILHGHASCIRIAGSIEDEVLKFSVADNGCGFDPENCPGAEQGHFGIEGIRERIRLMAGEMAVSSTPGKGTKTTISIHMPRTTPYET